ncbi:hypothetical protein F5B22DRAFT_634415 [Xylaria bambusicola]|uniref:uncharacterized protein n=1 Tax=Xylaria bambusicola TaxID=326684 RepID=UPI0020083976|nr:uncharacterized protein F5B22DRAFT_634415 [Xylaria bambusicola]KAI0521486.1 hypothetical protein F5B22DRAFT_634415 [Xylaria bambusicola]
MQLLPLLAVWRFVLQRHERIIHVFLRNRLYNDIILRRQGIHRLNSCEVQPYDIVVHGYQTLSVLFRVCRHSRDVALSFYRVHLPCWLIKGSNTRSTILQTGVLYFNPEVDFLYIRPEYYADFDSRLFVLFLHDLRMLHDPNHVGLLNLAIDRHGLTGPSGVHSGLCSIDPDSIQESLRSCLAAILKHLRQVFFVFGPYDSRFDPGAYLDEPSLETYVNRGIPVAPMALNFRRLHPDPRPIAQHLTRIYLDSDPNFMPNIWRAILSLYLGEGTQVNTEYRLLVSSIPDEYEIYDCFDGERWLGMEQCTWDTRNFRVEDFTQTVFGFWLFPIDAFGPAQDSIYFGSVPNFVGHPTTWPDLAWVELPRRL